MSLPRLISLGFRLFFVVLLAAAIPFAQAQKTIHIPADQPTIQAGINAASTGDTVLIAPGTYFENIDFEGKAITVTSSGGAASTIIDGGGIGATVTMRNQEPRSAVLSNLTITHGGIANAAANQSDGSGIVLYGNAPTILNNIITQNYCQNIGGSDTAPLIQGNVISNSLNAAHCTVDKTGGIHLGGANYLHTPVILGNTIENNTTGQLGDGGGDGGAGIWLDAAGSNIAIVGNIIRNNTTRTGNGGAILSFNISSTAIVNNLIYGNFAGCGGGAISFDAGGIAPAYTYLLANNTIVDNTGGTGGGYSNCDKSAQIYPNEGSYGSSTTGSAIINNIISGSTSYPAITCSVFGPPSESIQPTIQNNILYNGGGPFFAASCVDVSSKYGNIAADPQFVSPSTGDYHLKNPSPAIDSGQNLVQQIFHSLTGLTLSIDLDGNPRVQNVKGNGCVLDMGAYEYPSALSSCSVTETLQSSLNPSTAGTSVTFTAQLADPAGIPTGDVQFLDGTTVLATQTVSSSGAASFATSLLTIGTHTITANYQPSGSFGAATASLSQVVNGVGTGTTLTSSLNPAVVGQSVTFNAGVGTTFTNGSATGSVAFYDGSTLLATLPIGKNGGSNGGNTIIEYSPYTTSALSVGTHTITANYIPTGIFAPSSATLSQTILAGVPTTTALACAPNPAFPDQSIAFAVAVAMAGSSSGTPSGTVTLSDGGSVLTTLTLVNGAASYSASLPIGTHPITATYVPAAGYSASSATCSEVVVGHPTTTVLAATPNPAVYGTTVTLSATTTPTGLAAVATGSITFYDGTAALGTVALDAAGHASISTSALSPRTHSLTAVYSGSALLAASTSPAVAEVVTAPALTATIASSPNPSLFYQPVQLTAVVSVQTTGAQPALSGTVTFSTAAQPGGLAMFLGTAPLGANGTASLLANNLGLGTSPIVATYNGLAAYSDVSVAVTAVSPPLNQIVNPAPTALNLTATPIPADQGANLSLTAVISDAPSIFPLDGPIFFTEPSTGTTLGSARLTANGSASINVSTLPVGTHQLVASYAGLPNMAGTLLFLPSTSLPLNVTIAPSTFTVAFTPPNLTVQTAHESPAPFAITSLGSFADTLHLTCSNLPVSASCSFTNASPTLSAHEVLLGSVVLDTSGGRNCGNYDQASSGPAAPQGSHTLLSAILPLGLPLGFLILAGRGRSKRLARTRLLAIALLLFAATNALTGCGTEIWFPTPPGTYNVLLTAQGTTTGKTQTATLTFNVVPATDRQSCRF